MTSSYDQASSHLKEGNDRFASAHRSTTPAPSGPHKGHADTTAPLAAVFTCSDPGLAPEDIFDLPADRLYVVRAAAHVLDDVTTGSLEYAVTALGVQLIVVLGHDGCRLISDAIKEPTATGSLCVVLDALEQPVIRARRGNWPLHMLLGQAVREQVRQTVADLRTSHNIHPYLDQERVRLVGAVYSDRSGTVEWLDDTPTG
jgi:carbonic anhydrase